MFTPAERDACRDQLIAKARSDSRITGGAITGSKSVGREDAWSDIDLAFGVSGDLDSVIVDFTNQMVNTHEVVLHFDVPSGPWIYRVFLLANSLQVDLAFVSQEHFAARAETFQLLFGEQQTPQFVELPKLEVRIGWACLYALHTRSCLKRSRLWQAEYMLSALRNEVVSMMCQRNGLPAREGRGVDQLPTHELEVLTPTIPRGVRSDELGVAFSALVPVLLSEVGHVSTDLRKRLEPMVLSLTV